MVRMTWRSSMKFDRGVLGEKGVVKKKVVFSSTTIAGRKWAFNTDKMKNSDWLSTPSLQTEALAALRSMLHIPKGGKLQLTKLYHKILEGNARLSFYIRELRGTIPQPLIEVGDP